MATFSEAQEKWLAAMEERARKPVPRRPGMSPMDEFAWFELPRYTNFILTADNPKQIAKANPRRVLLLMGVTVAVNTVSVNISPLFPTTFEGFVLSNTTLPLRVSQKDDGNLCQVEWFGLFSPGSVLSVIEVFLRDWP